MTRMNSRYHFSVMKSGRSLDIKQQTSIFLPYLKQVLTFHDYVPVLSLLFWFVIRLLQAFLSHHCYIQDKLGTKLLKPSLISWCLLTIDFHLRIVVIRSVGVVILKCV